MYFNLTLYTFVIFYMSNMHSVIPLFAASFQEPYVSILGYFETIICLQLFHCISNVSFLLALVQLESFYCEAAAVNCKCLH